jgi:nucleotide-binding universal stress UspA family protein
LACDRGLPVHLVRVVDVDLVRAAVEAGAAAAETYATSQVEARHLAEADLAEQVHTLRDHHFLATWELRSGSPAMEQIAAEKDGDLVVLTTHERGGFARRFLGSVAEGVVRHAVSLALLERAPTADQACA